MVQEDSRVQQGYLKCIQSIVLFGVRLILQMQRSYLNGVPICQDKAKVFDVKL